MSNTLKEHKNIPVEMTWDLSKIFESDALWESKFIKIKGAEKSILELKGKIGDSPQNLANVIAVQDELDRRLEKLYVYAHLKADEDTSCTKYMGMLDKIKSHYTKVSAALSWILPEILEIDETLINKYIKDDALIAYQRELELIIREKPYTLSAKEEKILSMASEPLESMSKTYGLLSNADIKFPHINDENGNKKELTHGNYVLFLESENREVRKSAFNAMYDTYNNLKNTMAALLDGNVKKHVFYAKTHNFPSAIKSSLHADNVSLDVYDNLISSIHKNLPSFYKYVELRKEQLKLDKLDMYDIYVPIVPDLKFEVPYEQACEWVLDAVKILGEEYHDIAKKAFAERWIDVEECKGKRSGAYSSGCYDTNPYILMNYQCNLNNVFTLIHELGHSIHSYLSNKTQAHIYSDYKIFVAEVASTTNEALLHHYLMNKISDTKIKKYLLNHLCDEFKGTVFRQTMFAEFEKQIHEKIESGIPLTPDELCKSYYKLNKLYYGDSVEADSKIELEWARIPHFYYNFYVYKYATGFSAAQAFASKIISGDFKDKNAYLNFLRAGSSKDPLDILADAGVDLRTSQTVQNGLDIFSNTVDTLKTVIQKN